MKKQTLELFSLIFCFIFIETSNFAQTTDNTGKDLFVVKTTSKFSFPINSSGFSINYTSPFEDSAFDKHKHFKYLRNTNLQTYHIDTTQSENESNAENQKETESGDEIKENIYEMKNNKYTTVKDVGKGFSPFFLNLKITNFSIKNISQFFSPTNQPTVQLEIGAIQNSVLNFINWNYLKYAKPAIPIIRFHEYDFFYSAFINTSFINYVDTNQAQKGVLKADNITNITKFAQGGAKVYFNGYWSKVFAVALTGTLSYGLPLDNDPSYQTPLPHKIISSIDSPIYKNGQADGKYGGSINNPGWNSRISCAFPIFLNFLAKDSTKPGQTKLNDKTISHFYLLPSYAPFGTINTHWTQQIGCSINIMKSGYGGKNSSLQPSGGIGFDILSAKTHSGWGSPIFYISGTLDLGGLSKTKGQDAIDSKNPNNKIFKLE